MSFPVATDCGKLRNSEDVFFSPGKSRQIESRSQETLESECGRTVTVTEALVLRSLLEDRGHITESIRILVPVDRMKQNCFQIMMKRVR